MMKKKLYQWISGIMALAILLAPVTIVRAAYTDTTPTQEAPKRFRMDESKAKPLGYETFSGNYADMTWDSISFPSDSVGYVNFYYMEYPKPYKSVNAVTQPKETDIQTDNLTRAYRYSDLKSGTVYTLSMTARHKHTDSGQVYPSTESKASNAIKIMTDIQVDASSYGTNQIKIAWDDVWNGGNRITYKLYVSENDTFSNTQPVYITQKEIGQNGPVTVNTGDGKLEYIHTVRDPGRVYYVKVVPVILDAELHYNPESATVAASSFILAQTTKMSSSNAGTVWRLDWSPVVTGISGTDVKVLYQLYKGQTGSTGLPQYMASVQDTSFFVTLAEGETNSYFIIRALVTKNGVDMYPGITISSDKIFVKDSEVPYMPPAPEFYADSAVIGTSNTNFAKELTSKTAGVFWRAPYKEDGTQDKDIVYDIWLITDPSKIDNPQSMDKIATDYNPGTAGSVLDKSVVVGYTYKVKDLTPNTAYYFRIVAKKSFLSLVNGKLTNVTLSSQSALKLFITPSDGNMEVPLTPARPPLKIKQNGTPLKDVIGTTTAQIQLANMWYERLDGAGNTWVPLMDDAGTPFTMNEKESFTDEADPRQGMSVWFEQRADTSSDWTFCDTAAKVTAAENALNADPATQLYRKVRRVNYDSGVTLSVGVTPYKEGMTFNDINNNRKYPTDKLTGISTVVPADTVAGRTLNADPSEDQTLNTDGKKHNLDILVTGLDPNVTYVVWVRANRIAAGLVSDASDPLLITTLPQVDVPLVKPVVPTFIYDKPRDTSVELRWNFKPGEYYTLKYGTTEDMASAAATLRVTPAELQVTSDYLVSGLKPESTYYFWIQAEITNSAGTAKSEWSDAYIVRTLANIPPDTPTGFGLKNTATAVTKNSLTFEWQTVAGLQYILEIATDINYKDSKEISAGTASEATATGLRSNYRYYARLYAYDPDKKLRSVPTASMTVRTARSRDDYDSDQNIDVVLTGDFIVKDDAAPNGVWSVNLVGVNADRFLEVALHDKSLDYLVDLSNPPAGAVAVRFTMARKVSDRLASAGENLLLKFDGRTVVIRPGSLTGGVLEEPALKKEDTPIEVTLTSPDTTATGGNGATLLTTGLKVSVVARDGTTGRRVTGFVRPVRIVFPYTDAAWYQDGKTKVFRRDESGGQWVSLASTGSWDPVYSRGILAADASQPGQFAAGTAGSGRWTDMNGHWAQNAATRVAGIRTLRVFESRIFSPEDNITADDWLATCFDVLGRKSDTDVFKAATQAGIWKRGTDPGALVTRAEALAGASRLWEIATGQKAMPAYGVSTGYSDIDDVPADLSQGVRFAAENGIALRLHGDMLLPGEVITRAEAVAVMDRLLTLLGELD